MFNAIFEMLVQFWEAHGKLRRDAAPLDHHPNAGSTSSTSARSRAHSSSVIGLSRELREVMELAVLLM
jgi:hypothetical protein